MKRMMKRREKDEERRGVLPRVVKSSVIIEREGNLLKVHSLSRISLTRCTFNNERDPRLWRTHEIGNKDHRRTEIAKAFYVKSPPRYIHPHRASRKANFDVLPIISPSLSLALSPFFSHSALELWRWWSTDLRNDGERRKASLATSFALKLLVLYDSRACSDAVCA